MNADMTNTHVHEFLNSIQLTWFETKTGQWLKESRDFVFKDNVIVLF